MCEASGGDMYVVVLCQACAMMCDVYCHGLLQLSLLSCVTYAQCVMYIDTSQVCCHGMTGMLPWCGGILL